MRQLNERLSQLPESSQSRTTRDDIFTQVMGVDRRGWVRTFGLGVTLSDIYGPRASIAEARAAAAEARTAAIESAMIAGVERAQRISLQKEVVQMRTQLNQLMTWMQSFTGSGPSSSSSVPKMMKRRKKLNTITSNILFLPHEMLASILVSVASSSIFDLIDAKLVCKQFSEAWSFLLSSTGEWKEF